ncbi:hypothetical protein FBR02_17785 [Anaerolineae bacterium CFX9]|nr:hypothetical protein [Anaerolineae bacterium CFX9]
MAEVPFLVVLAGGVSSRMWPVREKSLLRFGPDPLLVSQLRRMQKLGFTDVIIVANPENQATITDVVSGISGLNIRVVVQDEARGMGDALLRTQPFVPASRSLYVTQVHDIVDDDLHRDMLHTWRNNPSITYIAGARREDYFPGGYLVVDANDRITGLIEKPGADRRPSDLVNIVAHIHAEAGRLFEAIHAEYARSETPDDHYERAMSALMGSHVFRVVPYHGVWKALKYPWHVLDVMDHYLSHIQGQTIAPGVFIADTARITGNVVIEEGVKIFPGAAVVGPAYIGAGTIVGNNALVRGSMVLDRCEVGFTTEIARSYVADHVGMHACRVLDSVFMPNVNFSAGCTTANLRIDKGVVSSTIKGERVRTERDKLGAIIGQGAFLSVDVMTMPGVKIGAGAQVGPGTHVHQDIRDGQRVYVKQVYHIVEPGE